MAAGVSGSVAFTTAGSTIRVYYAQSFTPGIAKSTVTISRVTFQSNAYRGDFFFDGKIIVDGKTVFDRSIAGSDGRVTLDGGENTINLCTDGSITVTHSSAKTISVELAGNTQGSPCFKMYYGGKTYTIDMDAGSRDITLSAIPMASGISAGAVTLGSEMTVSLTKAAEGMTDTVTWKCGTQSGTIVENSTGTSFTWTPPVTLAIQAPDSTVVPITITTATKNGDTEAGTSSVTVSCPIPASVKPTASLAVSDETGYLGTFGSYIRSQSKVRVVTEAAGAYGSSITGISVTCGSLIGTGASLLFSLPYAGTVTIRVTVTDSRGRTASAEGQIFVADYSPPAPGITELYRCDASGTPAPDGAWAKAVLTCAVTSLGGRNPAACVLRYRVRGTDGWTEKSVTAPGEAVFPADTGSDYQVRLTAADSFVTVSGDILPLPAAFALLDFDRKNKAAGIGQRAGTAGTLSVGMPIKMGTNRITDMGAPTDSADAATKGYVDAAVRKAAPRNLLDNSDFRNPVNQRGQQTYTGVRSTIDRWLIDGNAGEQNTMWVDDGYIGLSGGTTTENVWLVQRVPSSVIPTGNKATFAVKQNGMQDPFVLNIYAWGTDRVITFENGITLLYQAGEFIIYNGTGGPVGFVWAALYEGEYTAETLPEYHPKGYGTELAECQRYYQIRSTNNIAAVDMRPTMRLTSPTITSVTGGYAYSADL